MIDATVRTRDGRTLAYREWGSASGPAVLAFHGTPGSRVWWPGEEKTTAMGVRLITVDRPGYGGSDPLPGRSIAGWIDDVTDLTAALGIDRFGVVGWSAGGPYVAAVAALMPDRLTGACITSSDSLAYAVGVSEPDPEDPEILESIAAVGAAQATRRYAAENEEYAKNLRAHPETMFDPARRPPGDRWVFDDPEMAAGLHSGITEGLRQGEIGDASHAIALLSPWGFELGDIRAPVHLWYGGQDSGEGLADFERVAAAIPGSTLTVWPDAGHFGVCKHWGDVLSATLGA